LGHRCCCEYSNGLTDGWVPVCLFACLCFGLLHHPMSLDALGTPVGPGVEPYFTGIALRCVWTCMMMGFHSEEGSGREWSFTVHTNHLILTYLAVYSLFLDLALATQARLGGWMDGYAVYTYIHTIRTYSLRCLWIWCAPQTPVRLVHHPWEYDDYYSYLVELRWRNVGSGWVVGSIYLPT
jgi:hypothetical protein